jgi:hypothetical protein
MFWKKNKATDFERAKKAYYKYCYRNGMAPVKPLEPYSKIADGHVFLRNQFGSIAKIFFMQKKQGSAIQGPDHALAKLATELR